MTTELEFIDDSTWFHCEDCHEMFRKQYICCPHCKSTKIAENQFSERQAHIFRELGNILSNTDICLFGNEYLPFGTNEEITQKIIKLIDNYVRV